jgi:hypothetical protein
MGEVAALGDRALGAAVIVIAVVTLLALRDVALVDRSGPGPALAPAIVAVGLIATGVMLLVRAGRR